MGVILAGGASRRLGGAPKGLELVGGARIIDRVAAALRPLTCELVVASNHLEAEHWLPGVAVVRDNHQDAGGLAGVEAGLARGQDALVVAWDMPFVTTRVLDAILAAARRWNADVTLPESESPYGMEPFCAHYAARVRTPLTRFLAEGGGPARDFIRGLERVRLESASDLGVLDSPGRLYFSVNSTADLDRARAMAVESR
ncbi:MAG: molybdenum cofactor guanylyltransferase [Gemmatimonadaceae bacterium]